MKTKSQLEKMSIQELEAYIDEQKPMKEKLMSEAFDAPEVQGFMRLSRIACEPIAMADMYLRKIQTDFEMSKFPDYGDLMTLENFKDNVYCGGFIDSDGSGNYSTETEESDISIFPSDIKEGVYRDDFTHVVWYNK